jgi:hypothetical protein
MAKNLYHQWKSLKMKYLFVYAFVLGLAACGNHAADVTSVDNDHTSVRDSGSNKPDSLQVKDTVGKTKPDGTKPNNH